MRRQFTLGFSRRWRACVLVVAMGMCYVVARAQSNSESETHGNVVARGAGTTIVQDGTGTGSVGPYPPLTPVLTTLAFQAEKDRGTVTGALDCLARAPESGPVGSPQSAEFTVNVMYVTGHVTGVSVDGSTATLVGKADVTGLGAGTNVPFTFVVQKGGPGATAVLTVSGLTFNETLVEGTFEVHERQ